MFSGIDLSYNCGYWDGRYRETWRCSVALTCLITAVTGTDVTEKHGGVSLTCLITAVTETDATEKHGGVQWH